MLERSVEQIQKLHGRSFYDPGFIQQCWCNIARMATEPSALGEFEQVVLLAVMHVTNCAYGVAIQEVLSRRTRRRTSLGAIYMTLDRLEKKGLLASTMSEPTS